MGAAGTKGRLAMTHLLDNITWHALSGRQAQYATGTGDVRRYAPGFSPLAGLADPTCPDFTALAHICEPGEHLYCFGWTGTAPAGWQIVAEVKLLKMIWDAPLPATDEAPDAVWLGPQHASQVLELVALTRPGPFGPRTMELGDYFGDFDDQRLIAMAGERLQAGTLREVSGVCTHPDYRGRGLARRLMLKLIFRAMQRGETPFLHVMSENTTARKLYERMGFRDYQEIVARIVSRS